MVQKLRMRTRVLQNISELLLDLLAKISVSLKIIVEQNIRITSTANVVLTKTSIVS